MFIVYIECADAANHNHLPSIFFFISLIKDITDAIVSNNTTRCVIYVLLINSG